MSKMLFVNLPVADLAAASMVWSETITFHLLTRDYFATFTSKPVADAHAAAQVLLALTLESRAAVDAMVAAAAAAGGKADPRPATDLGWLYNRAFEDADGHTFEAVFADMAAMPAG